MHHSAGWFKRLFAERFDNAMEARDPPDLSEKKMSISTKPARGMRDFLAEDVLKRRYVTERIIQAYRSFGFQPLETPAIERLDVLTSKYGDEGDQLMFKILMRSEKLQKANVDDINTLSDLALHYDLTVPMARAYADNRHLLPRYYKRYQIQPVWRADRPQRGRFREFYQCDVDYVGTDSPVAEVEVISAMFQALENLQFQEVTVRLNDRKILQALLFGAGVEKAKHPHAMAILDRFDKIGLETVVQQLQDEGGLSADSATQLASLFTASSVNAEQYLKQTGERLQQYNQPTVAVDGLQKLIGMIPQTRGIRIAYDPGLVRGLSYYTGTIMEFETTGFNGSIAGGGRYDGLVSTFIKDNPPAVGGSLGLERLLVMMDERNMFPDLHNRCDVMIARMDEEGLAQNLHLAATVRQSGRSCTMFPETKKMAQQLKYADQIGARFVLIQGTQELASDTIVVRTMHDGEQHTIAKKDVLAFLDQA